MKEKLKPLVTEFKKFLKRQYFVLILAVTTAIKLCVFERWLQIDYPIRQMWIGWAFTVITVVILFSSFLFMSRYKKLGVSILVGLISIFLFADIIYFRFFLTLPTFGLLDALNQSADVMPSITSLIKYKDVWLFLDLALLLFVEFFILPQYGFHFLGPRKEKQSYLFEKIIRALVIFGTIILIVAFSFVPKYKSRLDRAIAWAYETRVNTQYFGVLGSHFLDAYRYFEEKFVRISPEEREAVINWAKNNRLDPNPDKYTGIAKDKRVILIQVESLSNFVIKKKIAGQEITPSLNDFIGDAHYFKNQQFVLGAGHTSDTDFVSLSSYWPLFDSSVFIRYAKDNFSGLIAEANDKGYESYAYHAYNRNFWNRSMALKGLGFARFYAMENYPKGKVINMGGLADRPFMAETAKLIKDKPERSVNFIITLSSHFPFTTTAETQGLKINIDNYPAFAGGYLQNINYTDAALGDFFKLLKENKMYDDSLIVVYGDHSPVMTDFSADEVTFRIDSAENKTVPFIVKLPGQTKGVIHKEPTTHLDITPTILDLMGIKPSGLTFGASVFDATYRSRRCSDGFIVAKGATNNCDLEKTVRKDMAAKIIKYNLFSEIAN